MVAAAVAAVAAVAVFSKRLKNKNKPVVVRYGFR
jgi:hypothetical protein